MKKSIRYIIAFVILLVLTGSFSACKAAANVPSVNSPDLSNTVSGEYKAREKPYSLLEAKEIASIRMLEYLDSQPPDWPDPYKDVAEAGDIMTLAGILKQIEIVKQVEVNHIPVGANSYRFIIYKNDGSELTVSVYGDRNLSGSGGMYEIVQLPDLHKIFSSLKGEAQLMPDDTAAPRATMSGA